MKERGVETLITASVSVVDGSSRAVLPGGGLSKPYPPPECVGLQMARVVVGGRRLIASTVALGQAMGFNVVGHMW